MDEKSRSASGSTSVRAGRVRRRAGSTRCGRCRAGARGDGAGFASRRASAAAGGGGWPSAAADLRSARLATRRSAPRRRRRRRAARAPGGSSRFTRRRWRRRDADRPDADASHGRSESSSRDRPLRDGTPRSRISGRVARGATPRSATAVASQIQAARRSDRARRAEDQLDAAVRATAPAAALATSVAVASCCQRSPRRAVADSRGLGELHSGSRSSALAAPRALATASSRPAVVFVSAACARGCRFVRTPPRAPRVPSSPAASPPCTRGRPGGCSGYVWAEPDRAAGRAIPRAPQPAQARSMTPLRRCGAAVPHRATKRKGAAPAHVAGCSPSRARGSSRPAWARPSSRGKTLLAAGGEHVGARRSSWSRAVSVVASALAMLLVVRRLLVALPPRRAFRAASCRTPQPG